MSTSPSEATNENLPLISVTVPLEVPFTNTETPTKGSLDILFVTMPKAFSSFGFTFASLFLGDMPNDSLGIKIICRPMML